jgi:hypothetical protein
MGHSPKTSSPAKGKRKSLAASSIAKRVAGVVFKKRLATAKSVIKMKTPSLKTILEDADEFQRRLQAGETKVLTPEEGARRLAAVLEKQGQLLEQFKP